MTQPIRAPLTANAPQTGWTVTSQQETIESGPNNVITRGKRIYFTLNSGPTGSIFLSDAMYNPANARAAIAAAAAQLNDVQNLSG